MINKYTFTEEDGSFVLQQTIDVGGYEHSVSKDIVSFYQSFSKMSYSDTGLMPLNGSGMLQIRKAGEYQQIAYQYTPDMHYINWGSHEGDSNARTYFVAQPYRIVIADIVNNNLLGARSFYSVEPITHMGVPLYHLNLPNVNCKGYRGNGVGWLCLYRNHDTTDFTFSSLVKYILERCSGTETYNDANMSETDGPRFYYSHYKGDSAYSRLWNPEQWEATSAEEGYEWTLDPELWIPVLVRDRDSQSEHFPDGEPLTYEMAVYGNYQAYYTDSEIPKPANRFELEQAGLDKDVYAWINAAFQQASNKFNPVNTAKKITSENAEQSISPINGGFEDESEQGEFQCGYCESFYDELTDVWNGNNVAQACETCTEEFFVCVVNNHLPVALEQAFWDGISEAWYDTSNLTQDQFISCGCSQMHVIDPSNGIDTKEKLNVYSNLYVTYYNSDLGVEEKFAVPSHTLCTDCVQSNYGETLTFDAEVVRNIANDMYLNGIISSSFYTEVYTCLTEKIEFSLLIKEALCFDCDSHLPKLEQVNSISDTLNFAYTDIYFHIGEDKFPVCNRCFDNHHFSEYSKEQKVDRYCICGEKLENVSIENYLSAPEIKHYKFSTDQNYKFCTEQIQEIDDFECIRSIISNPEMYISLKDKTIFHGFSYKLHGCLCNDCIQKFEDTDIGVYMSSNIVEAFKHKKNQRNDGIVPLIIKPLLHNVPDLYHGKIKEI